MIAVEKLKEVIRTLEDKKAWSGYKGSTFTEQGKLAESQFHKGLEAGYGSSIRYIQSLVEIENGKI